jgi:hypothetical protein
LIRGHVPEPPFAVLAPPVACDAGVGKPAW